VTSTANSLNSRMLNTGTYALEGETPVSGAQTGAPGKVQEAIDRLVNTAATNKPAPRQPRGRSGPEMGTGFGLGV
ncbi:MAG TPA: hypothetical protein VLG13_00410, partial [Patescibacteria group bacterium]|nr:hypothetical protein [Patescibacteria group bacterium]